MFKTILAVMSIILAIVSLCTACVRRKTAALIAP